MALFVIATPIGNNADFSERALATLRSADLVVGEEMKVLRQILKAAGVQARALDQLNEHSDSRDVEHLAELCREKNVALVSDCGTPGFCDPGADLVAACARAGTPVHAVPGPSSLMALLSICGVRVDQFTFLGFLPAKAERRESVWREIKKESRPVIVMETPYRTAKFLAEIGRHAGDHYCVVGLNLTQENERVLRGQGKRLIGSGTAAMTIPEDAEPIALLVPPHFKLK